MEALLLSLHICFCGGDQIYVNITTSSGYYIPNVIMIKLYVRHVDFNTFIYKKNQILKKFLIDFDLLILLILTSWIDVSA